MRPLHRLASACALALAFPLAPAAQTPDARQDLRLSTFAWGDWDGDGVKDAFVMRSGEPLRLLAFTPGGGFRDATREAGLPELKGVRQVAWQDFDEDGREDALLVIPESRSRLLRNDASGAFIETDLGLGLERTVFFAEWLDVDDDGRADLRLATRSKDRVFLNRGHGAFEELELGLGLASNGTTTTGAGTEASIGLCTETISDAFAGGCVGVSSFPTLGMLYPLGPEWNIDAVGRVGVGTLTPGVRLDVVGDVRSSGRLISSASSGAPLQVSSSTLVNNLNADLLDGLEASAFSQLGNTIGTAELEDGAVTKPKIGIDAVVTSHIVDFAITAQKIQNGAVGTNQIASSGVTNTDLAPSAVTGDKIANFTITGLDIGPNAITTDKIASNGVTNTDLGPSAVTGDKIANGTITGIDIASNAITTDKILDGTIGAQDLGLLTSSGNSLGVVRAQGTGSSATALVGTATSTSGLAMGLRGTSHSSGGRGVMGDASASTGLTYGVYGASSSTNGRGVFGFAAASSGTAYGVQGKTNSTSGAGVYGYVDAVTGGGFGVLGETRGNSSGAGIQASALFASGASDGLRASTDSSSGWGVWGLANTVGGRGVVGQAPSGGSAVHANGDLTVTGLKNFAAPHPTDPSKEVRFACLEGNESGTYFRGSAQLVDGRFVIEVPESFLLVSAAEGRTVQLTAYGPARIWVEARGERTITVRGEADVAFDYQVNGLRRGFEDFTPVRDNQSFRPRFKGIPFGEGLPASLRQVLVDTGILKADFTPDEATAKALGWELVERPDPMRR